MALRKVTRVNLFRSSSCARAARGSYVIGLECGCEIVRKYSEGVPKRAHCLGYHKVDKKTG